MKKTKTPAPVKRGPGQPTKYNPEIVKSLIESVELGMTATEACQLNDISQETYYTWIEKYPSFSDELKSAKVRRKQRNLALIQKHAVKTWQAAAWITERENPEYRLIQQVQATVNGQVTVNQKSTIQINLTPEYLESLEKKLSTFIDVTEAQIVEDKPQLEIIRAEASGS